MEDESDFELSISATIYGEDFSPRRLQSITDLLFEQCHEKDDEFVRKTRRGVYGNSSATFSVSVKYLAERNIQFDRLLDRIVNNYEAIKESGGTEISIWVAVFCSVQGNWAATAEQIQKIASFNGSLAVTYL